MSEFRVPVGQPAQTWLDANGFSGQVNWLQIGGNANNLCYLLTNNKNQKLVAKISSSLGDDVFKTEADGLRLIANTQAIRTPDILHVSSQCLIIEYLQEARQCKDYWATLAQRLAQLHRDNIEPSPTTTNYGLGYNNYCGVNQQVNGWFDDGHAFFCDQRLLYQARLAFDNGYLESPWIIQVESICERLTELIPVQPSSLLHGDLWSGNILVDDRGMPALIDPAVYYGWREADIAMTLLFGGLPHEFYLAYDAAWPMESHWRARVPLYNLYHLLNHLNIFGVSYLEQVQQTIARYA